MTFYQGALRVLLQVIRSEFASSLAKHALRAATVEVVRYVRSKTKTKTTEHFH